MNKSLYNKIINSVSKIVKRSINEAYDTSSIYDNRYKSLDELSILNSSGNIGDILQINLYGEYRVKPSNLSINESMFDDIDFEDDDYGVSVSDKLNNWKDFSICFGEGLWVYLDWVGFNKDLYWAHYNTKLHGDKIPDTNGYENTQYILNNYKNNIKGTIWEEILNCEYPIYISDKHLLERIYNVNEKYKLMSFLSEPYGGYWTSSLCAISNWYYDLALGVNLYNGTVFNYSKAGDFNSVALLHF